MHCFLLQVESPLDGSPDPGREDEDLCSTLDYLDHACPRDRIYGLLDITLQGQGQGQGDPAAEGQGRREGEEVHRGHWFDMFLKLSDRYELSRLKRVMRDVRPR